MHNPQGVTYFHSAISQARQKLARGNSKLTPGENFKINHIINRNYLLLLLFNHLPPDITDVKNTFLKFAISLQYYTIIGLKISKNSK
jgi:hypothetical protein